MIEDMTVTQTVDIPASRRLVIDVPREVPVGLTNIIIQFPVKQSPVKMQMTEAEEIELFKLHAQELNAEAEDVLSYQNMFLDDLDL
jgi:hypothetical protein